MFKAATLIPLHLVWVVILLSLFNKAEAVTCMSSSCPAMMVCPDVREERPPACPFFQTPIS